MFLNFNHEQGSEGGLKESVDRIMVGTQGGYKICDAQKNTVLFEDCLQGGVGLIDMKPKSDMVALVGGECHPKFKENLVIIWDAGTASNIVNVKETRSASAKSRIRTP